MPLYCCLMERNQKTVVLHVAIQAVMITFIKIQDKSDKMDLESSYSHRLVRMFYLHCKSKEMNNQLRSKMVFPKNVNIKFS